MEQRNDLLDEWDRDHFIHPLTPLGGHERGESPTRIVSSGSGVYIVDRNGRKLLDAFAGLFCVNVGYGRTEIAEAMAEQARKLAYYIAYIGHSTEASITLARMVAERTPAGLNHVYFGLGGSDANDTNVKFVWYYNNVLGRPKKKKIISRWRAYHGATVMAGSLTGLEAFHQAFNLPLDSVRHTVAPYYYRRPAELDTMSEEEFSQYCADRLETLIFDEGPDTVAAFIGEPMLGTGGIVPPPRGYWPRIQAVLKKYDVLLIIDEVATGFGRLGKMFATTVYDLDPDLLTVAKGITSAYAPLSASIVHDRIWKVMVQGSDRLGPLLHGTTYSAHPVTAAAGVANLKLVDELGLVANANATGEYLLSALRDALADHPMVGEVRGKGMLSSVELVEDRARRQFFDPRQRVAMSVVAAMEELGVVARAMPQSDVAGFAPPLCLTRAEADIIVGAARRAIDKVMQ